MASATIKFSAILLLVAVTATRISSAEVSRQPVNNVCLGCLCHAVSGCKLGVTCDDVACGPFYITRAYWADAGGPTINGLSTNAPDAYPSCTKDPYCAAIAVQGYMKKFAQDCNSDGRIDCYDYMAIHKLGGYGCTGNLPFNYMNAFNQCIAEARNKTRKKFPRQPVTDVCLGCLCRAMTGCKRSNSCNDVACGPFYITRGYWEDAGKPTINGLSTDAPEAYPSCTKDPYCAALTVQQYMRKYAQDCNGDNRIDCYDYLAIHEKGGFGACVGKLPIKHVNAFNQCIGAHNQTRALEMGETG